MDLQSEIKKKLNDCLASGRVSEELQELLNQASKEEIRSIYNETKSNLLHQVRFYLLNRLQDKDIIEEALDDQTFLLNIYEKIILIG